MNKSVILIGPMFGDFKISPRLIIGPFDNSSEAYWYSIEGPPLDMKEGEVMQYADMVEPDPEGVRLAKKLAAEAEANLEADLKKKKKFPSRDNHGPTLY